MNVLINSGSSLVDRALREMLLENGHNASVRDDRNVANFTPDVILVGIKTISESPGNGLTGPVVLVLDFDSNKSSLAEALLTRKIHGALPKGAKFSNFEEAVIEAIKEGRERVHEIVGSIIAALSKRGAQIIECVCQGYSNREIANRFFISPEAVGMRLSSIFKKFRTKNCSSLIALVMRGTRAGLRGCPPSRNFSQ